MKLHLAIFLALIISGCTSNAPKLLDLQSKDLIPPEGMTLVYILKEDIYSCAPLSMPFIFNGKILGESTCGQYLYYYTYPMKLQVIGKNDKLLSIDLEAGDINYLLLVYPRRGGIKGNYYKHLSQSEGLEYVEKYHLSANLKNIILGVKPTKNIATANKSSRSQLSYDDKTKTGLITMASNLRNRNIAIKQIEKICITKNIAIKIGSDTHKKGAVYTTLNESLKDGVLAINFQCLY